MANRLRPLLPLIISSEQQGVEGRNILDGIILVHEVLHLLRTNKIHGIMVNLEKDKAYDKLN